VAPLGLPYRVAQGGDGLVVTDVGRAGEVGGRFSQLAGAEKSPSDGPVGGPPPSRRDAGVDGFLDERWVIS
jgi:hypothetical protein